LREALFTSLWPTKSNIHDVRPSEIWRFLRVAYGGVTVLMLALRQAQICPQKKLDPRATYAVPLTSFFFLTSFGPKSALFSEKVPPYASRENVEKSEN
jgi:hypothetical protein